MPFGVSTALTVSCVELQLDRPARVVVVVVAWCVVDVEVDAEGLAGGLLLHAANTRATAATVATTVQRTG